MHLWCARPNLIASRYRYDLYPLLAKLPRPGVYPQRPRVRGAAGRAVLAAPQLARYRNVVRWILIGYAALTILLWILFGDRTLTGYTAKAIEIALIALLLLDARKARS
jgi:hypothetical protein